MLMQMKDYAKALGLSPEAIRFRIFKAKQSNADALDSLPAVKKMEQMAGTWFFTVDKKKFDKLSK